MRRNTAASEHFDVELWGARDEIHLVVSDAGKGFDLEAAKAQVEGLASSAWASD